MTENLDPLRQKPDFKALSKAMFPDTSLTMFIFDGPHRRTNPAWETATIEIAAYRRCYEVGAEKLWTSRVEPLMKELEILKSNDRDKFAIGFGNWIADYVDEGFKTTAELLELYKESLLNQKP